jgi:hypothetical protein
MPSRMKTWVAPWRITIPVSDFSDEDVFYKRAEGAGTFADTL